MERPKRLHRQNLMHLANFFVAAGMVGFYTSRAQQKIISDLPLAINELSDLLPQGALYDGVWRGIRNAEGLMVLSASLINLESAFLCFLFLSYRFLQTVVRQNTPPTEPPERLDQP